MRSKVLATVMVGFLLLTLLVVVILSGGDEEELECIDPANPGGGAAPVNSKNLALPHPLDTFTSGFRTPDRPNHQGVDLAEGEGTPIYAYADGVVAQAGQAGGFGQWIVIDHQLDGKQVSTVYGHMFPDGVKVKTGDKVTAGQHIADEGYNGEVDPPGPGGSHLHFEIWLGGRLTGGQAVDPMPWLEKAKGGTKKKAASGGGSKGQGSGKVVLIGDSLSVGARQHLEEEIPGVDIDAKVGRQFSEGVGVLEGKDTKDASTVIMALGTNGPISQGDVDRAKTAAGNANLVLMTVGGPGVSAADSVNQTVKNNASDVEVIDWAGQVRNHPDYIGADGIHPTPQGSKAFATTVASTVGGASQGADKPAPKKTGGKELPPSDKIKSEEHLQVDSVRVARAVAAKFPQIQEIGGWREHDAYDDHPSGRAVDIMIPKWESDEGVKLGDSIRDYLYGHRDELNIEYMIWRQRYIPSEGESNQMEDRGSPTDNHFDHVHVTTEGHGMPKKGQKYTAPDGDGASPTEGDDPCAPAGAGAMDRNLNDAEIPEELRKWIPLSAAQCDDIDAPLLAGLLYQESKFQPGLTSGAGAHGYAQFMPGTWAAKGAKVDDKGKVVGPPGSGDMNDPADATMAAGRYLCEIADIQRPQIASGQIKGDPTELMLAGYNAGTGGVQDAGGVPPYAETQQYVKVIPEHAKRFEKKL